MKIHGAGQAASLRHGAATQDGGPAGAKAPHAANGKAHGVVRKLGTGHFNPVAEAQLSAKFGHLVPAPEAEPSDAAPGDEAPQVQDEPSAATEDQPVTTVEQAIATVTGDGGLGQIVDVSA